jgi:hypothetical protein
MWMAARPFALSRQDMLEDMIGRGWGMFEKVTAFNESEGEHQWTSQRPDLLLELLRNQAVTGQDGQRTDLSCLVICRDMDDGHALRGAPEPLSIIQGVMLRPRWHAVTRNQALAMRLEGLEEEGLDARHGLTPNEFVLILFS